MHIPPAYLNREPSEWIDGVIPLFAPEADSLYDRRRGTVDIYTGIAFGQVLFGRLAAEPFYSRLSSMVGACGDARRVLDVGCGPGRIVYQCAPRMTEAEFACVDISREMARRAWETLVQGREISLPGWEYRGHSGVVFRDVLQQRNVWVAQADALDLPFVAGAFDVVVAALVLCRVRDPLRALLEMTRVLAPGGRLLVATPFAFNEPEMWERFWPGVKLREYLIGLGLRIAEWEEGLEYEEVIDANGNSHRYRVTVCLAERIQPSN